MDKKIIAALKKAGFTEFVIGFKHSKGMGLLAYGLRMTELMTVSSNLQDTIREEVVKGISGMAKKSKSLTKTEKSLCKKTSKLSSKKK